jgi:hypothetical protein
MQQVYGHRCYLHIQILIQSLTSNAEDANSSYVFARSVSVVDAVNWIQLAVKKIEAETVKKKMCFAKAGFEESDVVDNLEEASENIALPRKRTSL